MSSGGTEKGCGCLAVLAVLLVLGVIGAACGGSDTTTAPVAVPAPALPTTTTTTAPPPRGGTVTAVEAPHRFTLRDGTRVYLRNLESAAQTDNACQRRVDLDAAKRLLLNKRVTIEESGSTYVDPTVRLPGGKDYQYELVSATIEQNGDCLPASSSSSSDTDIDVDSDDDGESRFCSRRRWC